MEVSETLVKKARELKAKGSALAFELCPVLTQIYDLNKGQEWERQVYKEIKIGLKEVGQYLRVWSLHWNYGIKVSDLKAIGFSNCRVMATIHNIQTIAAADKRGRNLWVKRAKTLSYEDLQRAFDPKRKQGFKIVLYFLSEKARAPLGKLVLEHGGKVTTGGTIIGRELTTKAMAKDLKAVKK